MYSKSYNWVPVLLLYPKTKKNDQLVGDWDSHPKTHEFQLVSGRFFHSKQAASTHQPTVVSVGRVGVGPRNEIKRSWRNTGHLHKSWAQLVWSSEWLDSINKNAIPKWRGIRIRSTGQPRSNFNDWLGIEGCSKKNPIYTKVIAIEISTSPIGIYWSMSKLAVSQIPGWHTRVV